MAFFGYFKLKRGNHRIKNYPSYGLPTNAIVRVQYAAPLEKLQPYRSSTPVLIVPPVES